MFNLFYLMLIVIIIILIIIKLKPNLLQHFTNKLEFDDNVRIKGKILFNNEEKNNKIRVKKICIDGECIDENQFNFVLKNKEYRNKTYCLGDACIDRRHLEILGGDRNFKLQKRSNEKCLNVRDLEIHGKIFNGNIYHDDNDDSANQYLPNILHEGDCDKNLKSMEFKIKPEIHYTPGQDTTINKPSNDTIDIIEDKKLNKQNNLLAYKRYSSGNQQVVSNLITEL